MCVVHMTKEEAKIILLEQELVQAYHTINFMHGCLINPTGYKYSYPNQTTKELNEIKKLVNIPRGCPHSLTSPTCESCQERNKRHQERTDALKLLENEYPI